MLAGAIQVSEVRIKICGITTIEDALAVVSAGAHALGLVFYANSPRAVTIEQAREIALAVGPFVAVTGLFVNADARFVNNILSQVPLHLLQFHGDENAEYCESFQRPYMKAVRMRPDVDVSKDIDGHPRASGILLDAYRPGVPGGTGDTFDWKRVPRNTRVPIVLAGGLTPTNVVDAVRSTGVYGIDVSGGVESSPGKKDPNKVKAFITNARSA